MVDPLRLQTSDEVQSYIKGSLRKYIEGGPDNTAECLVLGNGLGWVPGAVERARELRAQWDAEQRANALQKIVLNAKNVRLRIAAAEDEARAEEEDEPEVQDEKVALNEEAFKSPAAYALPVPVERPSEIIL